LDIKFTDNMILPPNPLDPPVAFATNLPQADKDNSDCPYVQCFIMMCVGVREYLLQSRRFLVRCSPLWTGCGQAPDLWNVEALGLRVVVIYETSPVATNRFLHTIRMVECRIEYTIPLSRKKTNRYGLFIRS
jgi:hypothetical protein